MSNRALFVAGIIFLVILAFFPVRYTRVLEEGTDSFETHRPLFRDRVITQDVVLEAPVRAVAVIAADLRHAGSVAPVDVRILSGGQEIASQTIQSYAIQDDMFAWAALNRSASAGAVTIELSAPSATAENAVGIRFSGETKNIALAVQEPVPVWERIRLWRQDEPTATEFFDRALLASLIAGASLWIASRFGHRRQIWISLLILLACASFFLHLPTARAVEGVFGGDAFNFLLKGLSWIRGEDPFASDFRKGPLLPLLLLPAYLGVDPVWWGRIIGLASAALTAVVVAHIVRRLNGSPSIALGAGILVTVSREFWWQSVHGLSNIPYALLVTLGFAVLVGAKRNHALKAAVVTGLSFLMRFEGILVGAVLLPAAWIQKRFSWRKTVRMGIVAGVLIVIPFSLSLFSGRLGVRTPSDIAGDGGLSVAFSWDEYQSNWDLFELFWGRMWLLVPLVGWQFLALLFGAVVGIAMQMATQKWKWFLSSVSVALGILLVGQLISTAIFGDGEVRKQLTQTLSFVAGIGMGYLVRKKPSWFVSSLILILLQILLVTAILPKTRYYVQVIPFAAIAVVFGIQTMTRFGGKKVAPLLLTGIIGVSYADAMRNLPGEVSLYNGQSAETTVMIRAGRFLRNETGLVAGGDDTLAIRPYIFDKRLAVYNEPDTDAATALAWLREKNPIWVLQASDEPVFTDAIASEPELFEHAMEFTTRFGESRIDLYRYHGK